MVGKTHENRALINFNELWMEKLIYVKPKVLSSCVTSCTLQLYNQLYTPQLCNQLYTLQLCNQLYTLQLCNQLYTLQLCNQLYILQLCNQLYTLQLCNQLYTLQLCNQLNTLQLCNQLYTLRLCNQIILYSCVTNNTFLGISPGGISHLPCVIWPVSELLITCQLT